MNAILKKATLTDSNLSALILRITLAIVLWPHGAQLMLGLFGGYGFTGSMGYFISQGLPAVIAFLVIFLLFFGPVFMILGLGTRLFAFALLVLFIGMITTVHLPFGFFMNWFGNQKGEGFEYHLLSIGMVISLIVSGGGSTSLDLLIGNKIQNSNQ